MKALTNQRSHNENFAVEQRSQNENFAEEQRHGDLRDNSNGQDVGGSIRFSARDALHAVHLIARRQPTIGKYKDEHDEQQEPLVVQEADGCHTCRQQEKRKEDERSD